MPWQVYVALDGSEWRTLSEPTTHSTLDVFDLSCSRQVFCYALSPPDGSEWRTRIEGEVEHFTDVSAWSIPDIAARISADNIQVGCCAGCSV